MRPRKERRNNLPYRFQEFEISLLIIYKPLLVSRLWISKPKWHMPCCVRGMLEAIQNQANHQIAKNMLDVAHARQKALASNIANFENPGYKRVDVAKSFQSELHNAVKTRDVQTLKQLRPVLEQDPHARALRADGNNVSIEKEMFALNKNALEYEFATQLVSGSIKRLNTAIKGQAT